MNKENGHLDYVDIAKAIGIVLVVTGHVVAGDSLIKKIIYSFHMPLFFVDAGIVARGIDCRNTKLAAEFLSGKVKRLLVPYGIWALIYCPFSFRHCIQILYGSRELLLKAGTLTSLWFLPVLFTASILTGPVIEAAKRGRRRSIWACAIPVFMALGFLFPHHKTLGDPFGVDVAFVAAGLMLIGNLLRTWFEKAEKTSLCLYTAASLAVLCIALPHNDTSYGFVLMANGTYGNPFIFLICALSGSMCVLCCSSLLSEMFSGQKWMSWVTRLGQESMGVFLIHKNIIEWIRKGMQVSEVSLGETADTVIRL